MAALGPLSLGASARNEYYSSEEEYMTAVAECVRGEYRAIAAAGQRSHDSVNGEPGAIG